jgi:Uma2 family endonuclease
MSPSGRSSLDADIPAVDDNLAPLETRYEVWNGELVYVSPANPPHGELHAKVIALLEAHAARKYKVACDLLTRVSEDSDIAPDVSVYPAAPDPKTGGRQLEELAFEIVSTSRLGRTGERAAKLARRGVRRVFAIDVKRARALEWSRKLGRWTPLDPDGHISDRTLATPLPIRTLIRAGYVNDSVARALIAKRNPVVQQARAQDRAAGERQGFAKGQRQGQRQGRRQGYAEGQQQGLARSVSVLRETILAILRERGVALRPAERKRILAEQDLDRLQRWCQRAVTCTSGRKLF